jgi:REP element-mobilizing transposase RayT
MALYHVWFATKKRRVALVETTRAIVLAAFQETARTADIDLLEAEAQFDHAHLLLDVKADQN